MSFLLDRRKFLLGAGAGLLGGGLVSFPFGTVQAATKPITDRKLKIALSNSFIGNKWRLTMENLFKSALQMDPYKSEVEGSWFNSGNDVSKQSQQIANLISQGVDAILVDAASPTGLNGILHQASQRGILVVSFDNTVTEPTGLKIGMDEFNFGVLWAEFVAKKINGKGNVIMVTGVAGTYDDDERNKGGDSVWAKYPDIKVVARYTGMWDSAVTQTNTAAILPTLPKVDGIWSGSGTDGVLKAFVEAGRPLPPTAGTGENGFRKFMTKDGYMGQHVDGLSFDDAPFESVIALELARAVLRGTYPRGNVVLPAPAVTNDTIEVGVNVFPDQPDSLNCLFTDSGKNALVQFCIDAALNGTPCEGKLEVRLPKA
jgi:ribose transport system substrate-binding protein